LPVRPAVTEPPRRFYKAVDTVPAEGGQAVRLDGRTPKSPGGRALVLPTAALADLVAAEWAAQGEHIQMSHMRAARLAYTALDAVHAAHEATADEVARYAGSDVLCYRAEFPRVLAAEQAAGWDPILVWARETLDVDLTATCGIVLVPQSPAALDRVRALALEASDFALAGLAFATALYGSALLAFAVRHGRLTGEGAFDLSRIDEAFQERQWGVDEEAAERTERLRLDAAMIGAWFTALR
jgi:chaperone required for assembly of F1-ATPase